MTDLAQRLAAGQHAAVPKPSCIRPLGRQAALSLREAEPLRQAEPLLQPEPRQRAGSLRQPDSRRASARDALDAVLTGVRLGGRDRQFLSRLVHWDKRNASAVASLLWRARLAGRAEAALTQRQLEVMLAALADAVLYRTPGADAPGCWDCENIPGARCADHARDADRARACADLAVFLTARPAPEGLQLPTDISGYRRQASVAS